MNELNNVRYCFFCSGRIDDYGFGFDGHPAALRMAKELIDKCDNYVPARK